MKHLFRIGGALVLYIVVIHFLTGGKSQSSTSVANPEQSGHAALPSPPAPAPAEDPLFARQTEERIRQLTLQAERRAQAARAAQEMAASRRQIQTATYSAWKGLIDANQSAYLKLRAQAELSPHKEIPCTICDGFSYMPCLACPGRTGKCVSCNGSARRLGSNEFCASCLGTGKCYLCSGSGKMFCPFCDDGMITTRRPPPSTFPPAH